MPRDNSSKLKKRTGKVPKLSPRSLEKAGIPALKGLGRKSKKNFKFDSKVTVWRESYNEVPKLLRKPGSRPNGLGRNMIRVLGGLSLGFHKILCFFFLF